MPVIPAAEECLLVPFYVAGHAVGTIWAIMHSDRRKFDAEDDRVMAALGKFASSAYQALVHIEDLKFQVAEREKAEAAVRELANGLEAKFRCLVDANIMGIFIWNLEGKIVEANEAFLHIVEYDREDLVSGCMRWTDLTPPEWRDRDEHAVAELNAFGSAKPYEKEYLQKGGNRVPVLVGGALFEEGGNEGVAFVLDLSEQKRAQENWKEAQQALHITQLELARVSRLTTMGELAASIAHEVNQPLTAVTNNSNACLRLLAARDLEPQVLRRALEEIVADGTRASAVLAQIRALIKKTPAEKTKVDINEVIQEVLSLTGRELFENRILLERQLTDALPLVLADRVQLQQVLLNLIMNGIEAMTAITDQPRSLWVESRIDESGDILVAVRDSGTGLGVEADRVFTHFFTTKANGMGMGLPISRSLIESHGGRLWATPNYPHGAVFSFTLPVDAESPS
jgi:PAS domain S-box-containing protein